MTEPERDGAADATDAAAGKHADMEMPAVAEASDGVDAADAADAAGGEAAPDATRVVEAPDEEDLVAAPAWATFILVMAPFVVGLLVILALRWLL